MAPILRFSRDAHNSESSGLRRKSSPPRRRPPHGIWRPQLSIATSHQAYLRQDGVVMVILKVVASIAWCAILAVAFSPGVTFNAD